MNDVEGQLRRIGEMPTQSQRQISKAVNKLVVARVGEEFEAAEGRGDGRSWPATWRGREVADRLDWIGLDWMRLWEVARRLRLTGVGAGMGCGGGREEG